MSSRISPEIPSVALPNSGELDLHTFEPEDLDDLIPASLAGTAFGAGDARRQVIGESKG